MTVEQKPGACWWPCANGMSESPISAFVEAFAWNRE